MGPRARSAGPCVTFATDRSEISGGPVRRRPSREPEQKRQDKTCLRAGVPQASRAELCGRVYSLKQQQEVLNEITWRQREEIEALNSENANLRSRLESADRDIAGERAKADEAAHGLAKRTADDRARAELARAREERQKLEQELAMWRAGTARLKAARQAEVMHDAERGDFLQERKRLEQAVAAARKRLAELTDREEWEAAEFAAKRSSTAALCEELSEQRRRHAEVDNQIRVAEAQLSSLRDARRIQHDGIATDTQARLEAESSKLSDARLQLAGVSEERKRLAEELQEKTKELESLRQELDELTEQNQRLREGLHWGLQSLERIENEFSREPLAGAMNRHGELRGESQHARSPRLPPRVGRSHRDWHEEPRKEPLPEPRHPSSPRSPPAQPRERSASSRGFVVGGGLGLGRASSGPSLGYSKPPMVRRL